MKLENKIALITGGGRGIGRAIGFAFAREGANIAVASRTWEQVDAVAQEINNECEVETVSVVCDVSNGESVRAAFAEVKEAFGRGPDIMVNNAGIAESSPFLKTDDALWQRHLAINLTGTFYCTQAALPDARTRLGKNHQHRVDRRKDRCSLHCRLCRFKAWSAGDDAVVGARGGSERNHRKRDLSGLRRYRDDHARR